MKTLHAIGPNRPTWLDPERYYRVEIDHARMTGEAQVTFRMRLKDTGGPWFEFIANRFYWAQADCDSVIAWQHEFGEYYPLNFYGSELMAGTNS